MITEKDIDTIEIRVKIIEETIKELLEILSNERKSVRKHEYTQEECVYPGCNEPLYKRGACKKHYDKHYNT